MRSTEKVQRPCGAYVGSGPGVPGSPQRSRHCHGDSREPEYARGKVESSFGAGAGSRPVACPAGDRPVVRDRIPLRSLDDGLSCVVSELTASGSLCFTRHRRPKNLWGAYVIEVIRKHLGPVPKLVFSSNFGDLPERIKTPPLRALRWQN